MKVKNSESTAFQGQESYKSVFHDMNVLNEILRERTHEKVDSGNWSK